MPDPPRSPFSYAIVRIVPRIERGERVNAGVILFCRQRGFLAALVALDEVRLEALDASVSAAEVHEHLDAIARIAAGDPSAGPIGTLPASERFGWLVAPSSTIIQTSEPHPGLTADPQTTLESLFADLVSAPTEGRRRR